VNIAELLFDQALARPHTPAIIEAEGEINFGELEEEAAGGASLLWEAGLRPGDAVLVFVPMSARLYAVLAAIFRVGLTAMFIDPSAGLKHLERCCAIHSPRGFVGSPKAHLLRLVSPALRRIPVKLVTRAWVPGSIPWGRSDRLPMRRGFAPGGETPALITFTSGSTGQPKATVRTHDFLIRQYQILHRTLRSAPGEVDMATLPIVLLANLASGVTSLIPDADLRRPGAIRPGPVVRQILQHGVHSTAASPAFFERLVAYAEKERLTLPSFRRILSGGAPVFPRLMERLQQIAPKAEIEAVYGSTEAEPIAHLPFQSITVQETAAMKAGKGLLVGRPDPQIQLRILRSHWGKLIGPFDAATFEAEALPPGETGEVVVSGPHVLTGYLNGEGDEETKFRVDGAVWHRTGDAGFLDQQGRLWLMGRIGARISDLKGDLYPFSVECALSFDPAIRRTAVAAHRGKRILLVESAADVGHEARERMRSALSWAALDEVRWCPCLPVDKRHNAKIDYTALERLLERG
jgi:acyl-CoA synthetase (AMP-forming)/AMP-acid ligase II